MWNRNEISEHSSERLLLWVTQLLIAAWQTHWLFYCVQIYGQICFIVYKFMVKEGDKMLKNTNNNSNNAI